MKETVKQQPKDSITITIEKNEYIIKFPNTGVFLDLEREKIRLSGGYQAQLMDTNSGFMARMLGDAIATFTTLIPNLKSDLNVENIFETDIIFSKKLVKIYSQEFLPWYNDWIAILQDIDVD